MLVDTLSTSRLYGVHARSEPGMAQPVVGSCLCHTNLRLLLLDYGLLRMMLKLLFGYFTSSQLFHLVYAGDPCFEILSGGGAEISQATDDP